ncbi:hypothetical protein [Microbacterium lacticum]|uniref:hypothetical protein n=1 Tax=Microbacterium lacticum TaxID=33885 RepID=UPI001F5A2048|nr:hypothetical protein [Microbacterium lacticum]
MPGVMHTVTGNEIPLVLLAVFAGSAALLVISDDVPDPTATAAGVAVSALVALGLFWVQLRARRAQPALDKDLHDALGERGGDRRRRRPRHRPRRPHDPDSPGATASCCRSAADAPASSAGATSATGPTRAHRLDVYRDFAPATARPVVVHLHAGGFVQAAKSRESRALLLQLAAHG